MAEDRRRAFAFSSEHPVKRWFGEEILDHSPKSVRMGFMNSGRAPLLKGHDQRIVIGIIEKASIDKDRIGRGVARFGRGDIASDALRDVDDGILVNTSVGYRVYELVLERMGEDGDTYRCVDWEPLENSIVGVPADPDVGMGRAAVPITPPQAPEVRDVRTATDVPQQPAKPAERSVPMTDQVTAPAGASAEVKPPMTAAQGEAERREIIINTCKQMGIDSRVEARWINDGATLSQVQREIIDMLEERGKTKPTGAGHLGMSPKDVQRYSLVRAIRALKFPNERNIREASYEMECSSNVAKLLNRGDINSSILIPTDVLSRRVDASAVNTRAMATTPGASGGYLVNVENMGFIEILRNRSVAMNMGARNLSGLVGNVVFPRQTGKSTVTWQGGEGVSVAATDQALGQLSMTPKTAIIVTDVSEQLLRQSSPSAEAFITADLAQSIAIDGVDNAVINGTGGAQPLGIKNTTGVTTGQDAATFSYAKALAFPVAAGTVNAIRGNPGWVTNIAGAAIAMQRQRFTSTDSPLWQGNLLDGQLVGFRAMSSEQLAAANLIFGSWDECVIGDWGVLELATDNGGTRFNQAQVGIRAMWMIDHMLRYPQAFVVSVNLS